MKGSHFFMLFPVANHTRLYWSCPLLWIMSVKDSSGMSKYIWMNTVLRAEAWATRCWISSLIKQSKWKQWLSVLNSKPESPHVESWITIVTVIASTDYCFHILFLFWFFVLELTAVFHAKAYNSAHVFTPALFLFNWQASGCVCVCVLSLIHIWRCRRF